MKVDRIVTKLLTDVTPSMHKVRRQSLNAMVTSLLSGSSLSVTSIGRHINSQTSDKHQIKRSMRLCSNHHLHHETNTIYSHMAQRLIALQRRPIILVDWSDLDTRKQHFLLRASLAVDGRSLTLLEQVYPVHEKEKPATHKQFMERLKTSLPLLCKPIIVTDAGFRVPWFKLVDSLGFDYVGRVRNQTFCKSKMDLDWHPVKDLYRTASAKPKDLGAYQMSRATPIACSMVNYKQKPKGRKHLTATGNRARRNSNSRSNASKESEPWLLATSLVGRGYRFARKVMKLYQSRMQIEESFRDLKTGLGFNESNTRKQRQLGVLLLLAMLAQVVLFLLGLAVKKMNQHHQYQANSLKTRAVLSYQFIGLRAYKDRRLRLTTKDWDTAITELHHLMQVPLHD